MYILRLSDKEKNKPELIDFDSISYMYCGQSVFSLFIEVENLNFLDYLYDKYKVIANGELVLFNMYTKAKNAEDHDIISQ